MKIWLDDVRPAPEGYTLCHSVNEAKDLIMKSKLEGFSIELLDLDHDLGDYAEDGGDAIKLLDWLEFHQFYYPIQIHSMNPVGRANMLVVANRLKRYM